MWYAGEVSSAFVLGNAKTIRFLLNGPPVAGSPEIDTWTLAPVPLELVLMATAPLIVFSVVSGKIAMYCVPIGLFSTTGANCANARERASRSRANLRERMVVIGGR